MSAGGRPLSAGGRPGSAGSLTTRPTPAAAPSKLSDPSHADVVALAAREGLRLETANCQSGWKGVYQSTGRDRAGQLCWRAQAIIDGQSVTLGTFANPNPNPNPSPNPNPNPNLGLGAEARAAVLLAVCVGGGELLDRAWLGLGLGSGLGLGLGLEG